LVNLIIMASCHPQLDWGSRVMPSPGFPFSRE